MEGKKSVYDSKCVCQEMIIGFGGKGKEILFYKVYSINSFFAMKDSKEHL